MASTASPPAPVLASLLARPNALVAALAAAMVIVVALSLRVATPTAAVCPAPHDAAVAAEPASSLTSAAAAAAAAAAGPSKRRSNRFIILAAQRTGSTLLNDLLDAHPEITGLGEVFGGGNYGHYILPSASSTYCQNWTAQEWAMEEALAGRLPRKENHTKTIQPNDIVGIKHLRPCVAGKVRTPFVAWLKRHHFAVIQLSRRNLLEAYLSMLTANKVHLFHPSHPDDPYPTAAPLVIEIDAMLKYIRLHLESFQFFRTALETAPEVLYHEVSYESFQTMESRSITMRALYAALGVAPFEVAADDVSHRRLNYRTCRERIRNWEEVVKALQQNRFTYMLELCRTFHPQD